MSQGSKHVIFGAGQIGSPLARLLRERGATVRLVRRSGGGPDGIEVVTGDAGDPAFAAEATREAAVVYHCLNPAYDSKVWARELPRLMDSLLSAARRAGARLVVLDNLYMLGKPQGRRLDEDSPIAPCSRKGQIRARVNEQMLSAHARGDVRVVVGRASDYYGPGGTLTFFGDAFWPQALKDGGAPVLMNVDTPHTYHYTLDVAAGLASLGSAPDDVTGRWWMLPAAPAESHHAMVERFGRALGHPLRVRATPPLMLLLLRPFVPILGEIAEMLYQWEEPFVVDDRRFRERFQPDVTSLDVGAAVTADWARRHYGRLAAAR